MSGEKAKKERRFNQGQYEMLLRCSDKKDMSEWNDWQDKHPVESYLEGADLSRAHLKGANLSLADLRGAKFCHAHLEGANFSYANLVEADLFAANLTGAKLSEVNLRKGSLREARLENTSLACADLTRADLYGASLKDADLTQAILNHADFTRVDLKGAILAYAFLKNATLSQADLQEADLSEACLRRAKIYRTNLRKASLVNANLEHASLPDANLSDANLTGANLEGADLTRTDLKGSVLRSVCVNGRTLISGERLKIDRRTDFTGTALANARVDPKVRPLLEYNIRRIGWESWYKEHPILSLPVWFFWYVSDYGRSTTGVLKWFLYLALLFACLYTLGCIYWPPGFVENLWQGEDIADEWVLPVVVRPLYFSIVTQTTLGFGDMHAHRDSMVGHILLTLQVLLGYFLLGALVTRLSILFTAGGPSAGFAGERSLWDWLREKVGRDKPARK